LTLWQIEFATERDFLKHHLKQERGGGQNEGQKNIYRFNKFTVYLETQN